MKKNRISEHPGWYRLSAIAVLLSLALQSSGCTIWIEKTNIVEQWNTVQVVREQVTGEPERRVVPHADGLGWTVEVREPIEQTMARTGTRSWQGRQGRVMPIASWVGATIGCSITFGGTVIFDGVSAAASLLQLKKPPLGQFFMSTFPHMCVYPVIGIIPEQFERQGSERIVQHDHTEAGWRPVTQGAVGIRLVGREWMRYPMDESGRVGLRLERLPLPAVPSGQEPVMLGLWVREKQLAEWTERVEAAAWQRLKDEPAIPVERWPSRLVVGLLPWRDLPEPGREHWERRLMHEVTRITLARGGRIVPLMPETRRALEGELVRQYGGRVAEDAQVSPGREAGATVLVRPVARTSGKLIVVGADVLFVETGETVASVGWEVPSEALESAAEAVVARIVRTMGQAPRQ